MEKMGEKTIAHVISGVIRLQMQKKKRAISYAKAEIKKETDRLVSIISRCEQFKLNHQKEIRDFIPEAEFNIFNLNEMYHQLNELDYDLSDYRDNFIRIFEVYGKAEDRLFFFGDIDHVVISYSQFTELTRLNGNALNEILKDLIKRKIISRKQALRGFQYKVL